MAKEDSIFSDYVESEPDEAPLITRMSKRRQLILMKESTQPLTEICPMDKVLALEQTKDNVDASDSFDDGFSFPLSTTASATVGDSTQIGAISNVHKSGIPSISNSKCISNSTQSEKLRELPRPFVQKSEVEKEVDLCIESIKNREKLIRKDYESWKMCRLHLPLVQLQRRMKSMIKLEKSLLSLAGIDSISELLEERTYERMSCKIQSEWLCNLIDERQENLIGAVNTELEIMVLEELHKISNQLIKYVEISGNTQLLGSEPISSSIVLDRGNVCSVNPLIGCVGRELNYVSANQLSQNLDSLEGLDFLVDTPIYHCMDTPRMENQTRDPLKHPVICNLPIDKSIGGDGLSSKLAVSKHFDIQNISNNLISDNSQQVNSILENISTDGVNIVTVPGSDNCAVSLFDKSLQDVSFLELAVSEHLTNASFGTQDNSDHDLDKESGMSKTIDAVVSQAQIVTESFNVNERGNEDFNRICIDGDSLVLDTTSNILVVDIEECDHSTIRKDLIDETNGDFICGTHGLHLSDNLVSHDVDLISIEGNVNAMVPIHNDGKSISVGMQGMGSEVFTDSVLASVSGSCPKEICVDTPVEGEIYVVARELNKTFHSCLTPISNSMISFKDDLSEMQKTLAKMDEENVIYRTTVEENNDDFRKQLKDLSLNVSGKMFDFSQKMDMMQSTLMRSDGEKQHQFEYLENQLREQRKEFSEEMSSVAAQVSELIERFLTFEANVKANEEKKPTARPRGRPSNLRSQSGPSSRLLG